MAAELPATGSKRPRTRPATARVFFALWPPAALAAQLAAIARDAADRFGGRPTREDTIHLTLAFLGEVPETRLPEIARLAAGIQAGDIELCIDHLDFWPHNHLLWAGCSRPPKALRNLVDVLRQRLVAAGIKVDAGRHSFTPHLSLVRRVPEAGAPSPEQVPLPIAALHWSSAKFVLVRSQASSAGPDYRILAEFSLSAD